MNADKNENQNNSPATSPDNLPPRFEHSGLEPQLTESYDGAELSSVERLEEPRLAPQPMQTSGKPDYSLLQSKLINEPRRKSPKKLLFSGLGVLTALLVAGAGYYFGLYLPNTPENVYDASLNHTGDAVSMLTTKLADPAHLQKQLKSELSGNLEATYDGGKLTGTLSGFYSQNRITGKANLTMEDTKKSKKYAIELDGMAKQDQKDQWPDQYFRINAPNLFEVLYPDATIPPSITKLLNGQWVELDSATSERLYGKPSEEAASALFKQVTAAELSELVRASSNTTDEYLLTADKDKAILENSQFLGEVHENNTTLNHYKVVINQDHAKTYCDTLASRTVGLAAAKKFGNYTDKDIETRQKDFVKYCVDGFKEMPTDIELWADKDKKIVAKIGVTDTKKNTYTELSQTYDNDTVHLNLLNQSGKDKKDTVEASLTANVTSGETTGTLTVNTKGSKENSDSSMKASFTLKPYDGEITVEKPANTRSFTDVLHDFGISDEDLKHIVNPPKDAEASAQQA